MTSQGLLQAPSIAVFYLARGADWDSAAKFRAFRESYCRWTAGLDHELHVIFKGFANAAALAPALKEFHAVRHRSIFVDDAGFDLGAYFKAAGQVEHDYVCFLNTASEICGPDWLLKLATALSQPNVGIVGCSVSYEAPPHPGQKNLPFPNPHVRSNAFMIRRNRFLALRPERPLVDKMDAHVFEHGVAGITRRIEAEGLKVLLVGKNGRSYEQEWWAWSGTFRQGAQENLLVTDNQTKSYDEAPIAEKRVLFRMAWGNADIQQVGRLMKARSTTGEPSQTKESTLASKG
jgi:hypothetical protein